MQLTYWEAFTARAPEGSEQWATSDRGWLLQDVDGVAVSFGNYLDYSLSGHYREAEEQGDVHAIRFTPAVRCNWDDTVQGFSSLGQESRYFVTVAQAQAWIEEKLAAGILWPSNHPNARQVV